MKKKKSAIIFLSVVLGIGFISLIATLIIDVFDLDGDRSSGPHIVFYNPDFDSDIMNESEYLALDRTIKYSDGALTWEIANDKNDKPSDKCQAFLIEYIRTLVAGDGKKLHTMYSPEVIKALDIPDLFPEQRIYETVFTELSFKEMKENGVKFLRYEIKAEYKIQKNDGMFRSDLPSNAVKAQILVIDIKSDSQLITSVVEYKPQIK